MGRLVRCRDKMAFTLAIDQVIGRLSSCALQLDSLMVSGVHALLRWSDRGWEVKDLGSQNGTKVGATLLAAGESAHLTLGETLTFGESQETWRLVDVEEPQVRVVPLDGSAAIQLRNNMLTLPNEQDPQFTIYHSEVAWQLEGSGQIRTVRHDEILSICGRKMRFEAPSGGTRTPILSTRPRLLRSVILSFLVSRDEEQVELILEGKERRQNLGCHSYFYLGLVLARQRLKDTAGGFDDPGWIEVPKLLRMIPEYASHSHLNVNVYRLRQELGAAGIVDAARLIERHRGKLRLGTAAIRVEPAR